MTGRRPDRARFLIWASAALVAAFVLLSVAAAVLGIDFGDGRP